MGKDREGATYQELMRRTLRALVDKQEAQAAAARLQNQATIYGGSPMSNKGPVYGLGSAGPHPPQHNYGPIPPNTAQCFHCGYYNHVSPGASAIRCHQCNAPMAVVQATPPPTQTLGPLFTDKQLDRIAEKVAMTLVDRLGTLLTNALMLKAGFNEALGTVGQAGGGSGEGAGRDGGGRKEKRKPVLQEQVRGSGEGLGGLPDPPF